MFVACYGRHLHQPHTSPPGVHAREAPPAGRALAMGRRRKCARAPPPPRRRRGFCRAQRGHYQDPVSALATYAAQSTATRSRRCARSRRLALRGADGLATAAPRAAPEPFGDDGRGGGASASRARALRGSSRERRRRAALSAIGGGTIGAAAASHRMSPPRRRRRPSPRGRRRCRPRPRGRPRAAAAAKTAAAPAARGVAFGVTPAAARAPSSRWKREARKLLRLGGHVNIVGLAAPRLSGGPLAGGLGAMLRSSSQRALPVGATGGSSAAASATCRPVRPSVHRAAGRRRRRRAPRGSAQMALGFSWATPSISADATPRRTSCRTHFFTSPAVRWSRGMHEERRRHLQVGQHGRRNGHDLGDDGLDVGNKAGSMSANAPPDEAPRATSGASGSECTNRRLQAHP